MTETPPEETPTPGVPEPELGDAPQIVGSPWLTDEPEGLEPADGPTAEKVAALEQAEED